LATLIWTSFSVNIFPKAQVVGEIRVRDRHFLEEYDELSMTVHLHDVIATTECGERVDREFIIVRGNSGCPICSCSLME
jgi:hypothetical protein